MSRPSETTSEPLTEKTFSSYNQEQGKVYAKIRLHYHPSVYETVLKYHTSTGGQLDTLIDIGCGPGIATFGLAPHFPRVIGLDPSEGMISTARSMGIVTSTAEPVRFEIATAEDLGANLSPPVPDSSVDLIIAANAAHWFNISKFWARAGRVLKPGGTVALWTSGDIRAHPSMPQAAAIQAAMDDHYLQHLKPYVTPGNVLTRNRYVALPLPWTLGQPVVEFDQDTFVRKEWDVGEQFFVGPQESDLDTFEKVMGTGSAVTRWREDHPDRVGTEKDVVKILRSKLESILREGGIEPGKEILKGDVQGVLLMMKRNK